LGNRFTKKVTANETGVLEKGSWSLRGAIPSRKKHRTRWREGGSQTDAGVKEKGCAPLKCVRVAGAEVKKEEKKIASH